MGRHNLKFGGVIAAAGALLIMSSAGSARADVVSYTVTPGAVNGVLAGSTYFTFNSDTAPSTPTIETSGGIIATFSGPAGVVNSTSIGNYIQPLNDPTNYLTVAYPTTPTGPTSTETISFSGADSSFTSFGLYLGTIDTYNSISLLGNGGTVLYTLTGAQILSTLASQSDDSTNGDNNNSSYVEFVDTTGANITGIQLSTTQAALESDNLSVAGGVPEPATWAMMLIGFGLVGLQLRRRRAKEEEIC